MDKTLNMAIVYHSGYGHTQVMAQAIAQGAGSVKGAQVHLIAVQEVESNWHLLDNADAMIFGTPTYFGSVSADFKKFMEATSSRWYSQQWKDKIAAGFTNSSLLSGDKLATLTQLVVFAAQHSMLWSSVGFIPDGSKVGTLEEINRIGSFLGVMAQSDAGSGPDIAPPQVDKNTGLLFGKRVSLAAMQWIYGKEEVPLMSE